MKSKRKPITPINALNHMLCWNPNSSDVALVPHPDLLRKSRPYRMTALACNANTKRMSFKERKLLVYMEIMHLIIRDKVDPQAIHETVKVLDEYQDGLSYDYPDCIINDKDFF